MELERKGREAVVLSVSGMTCGGCARTVERILSRMPGVTVAKVELVTSSAVVMGDVAPRELVAALSSAGYAAQIAPASL